MTTRHDTAPDTKPHSGKPTPTGAPAIAADDREHGEGNYQATRNYNRDTKAFIDAGKVDDAARNAAPEDADSAKEMEKAEAEGASRAKN